MSKTRKLISVLVAIMMVVSMFAIAANAANYEDDDTAAEYTQDWALGEPVDNGDGTWSVDVYLTTNYATGPIQFVLTNSDTDVATIESVSLGDAIPEDYNATVSVSKSKKSTALSQLLFTLMQAKAQLKSLSTTTQNLLLTLQVHLSLLV